MFWGLNNSCLGSYLWHLGVCPHAPCPRTCIDLNITGLGTEEMVMAGNEGDGRWVAMAGLSFTRATLCYSAVFAVVVGLSVCPSQAGTVPKWLNIGSRKQRRTIAQGL